MNLKINLKVLMSKEGMVALALVFSFLSLGFSAYNTYRLNSVQKGGSLAVTKKFKKMTESEIEKIIKAGAPILGNADAPVTVIEFADFQCPYCGKYQKDVFPSIKSNFIDSGKVRFIHMDFAFLGEESMGAAMAARCAKDQGKFWEYHSYLYENQQGENRGAFEPDNLKGFAKKLGLNVTDFNQCLDRRKYENAVKEETNLGKEFGVNGTPATFVNDFLIPGLQGTSHFMDKIQSTLKNLD